MSNEMQQLRDRIASLEAMLAGRKGAADKQEDEKGKLAAEIEAFEKRLAADDDTCKAEDKKEEKKASEVDPNGIEEQITQDKFTEVEKITHGEELATGPSMGAVAPTKSEYVARLKSASVRLDKVADYLEKHGRRELAHRLDVIADEIDEKIKQEEK